MFLPSIRLAILCCLTGLLAVLALACSEDSPASSPEPAPTATTIVRDPQGWSAGASLPTSRVEVAFAVLDGKFYVIGGFIENSVSSAAVEAYDARSNTWQTMAPMPEPRDHPTAVAFDGLIYVFGGAKNSQGTPNSNAWVYDPRSNTWSTLPDLPLRRRSGGAAVIEGKIILVGGTGDSPAETLVFDPAARTWNRGPALPAPIDHAAVASADGKVYTLGGRWQFAELPLNLYLESLSGAWKTAAPIPTLRGGTVASTLNGRIYVVGGEVFNSGPMHTVSVVEAYDPRTNSWSLAGHMQTGRHALAVGVIDGKLYITGGGPTPGLSFDPRTEIFEPRP